MQKIFDIAKKGVRKMVRRGEDVGVGGVADVHGADAIELVEVAPIGATNDATRTRMPVGLLAAGRDLFRSIVAGDIANGMPQHQQSEQDTENGGAAHREPAPSAVEVKRYHRQQRIVDGRIVQSEDWSPPDLMKIIPGLVFGKNDFDFNAGMGRIPQDNCDDNTLGPSSRTRWAAIEDAATPPLYCHPFIEDGIISVPPRSPDSRSRQPIPAEIFRVLGPASIGNPAYPIILKQKRSAPNLQQPSHRQDSGSDHDESLEPIPEQPSGPARRSSRVVAGQGANRRFPVDHGHVHSMGPQPSLSKRAREKAPARVPGRRPPSSRLARGAAPFPQNQGPKIGCTVDGVKRSSPLTGEHYGCPIKHATLINVPNNPNPLTCQACGIADKESRMSCFKCHMLICQACAGLLVAKQGDLGATIRQLQEDNKMMAWEEYPKLVHTPQKKH